MTREQTERRDDDERAARGEHERRENGTACPAGERIGNGEMCGRPKYQRNGNPYGLCYDHWTEMRTFEAREDERTNNEELDQ